MGVRSTFGLSLWMILATSLALLLVYLVLVQGTKPAQAEEEPGFDGQVVGGTPVPNGKYPFVAALRDTRYGNDAYQQQFCGGTLIDPDSILTAAHCVSGLSARPLRVTVGRTVLKSSQGKVRKVSRIFVHPDYNAGRFTRDAAVLRLARPVEGVEPVKLARKNQNFLEKEGTKVTVAGWGAKSQSRYGETYPNRMREARIPVKADRTAKLRYKSFVPRLMVAAGSEGVSACFGDSGGPIFKKVGNSVRQVGITSFGPQRCGTKGYPGVYAEVNNHSIKKFISNAARR